VLLDADLAVLGAEPAAYAAYVNGVRSEYGHLSEAEWADGRTRIVERLLARTSLYATAPARSWWDGRARANLTAELAGLTR
jgi:predicted metal-dependent HD superfamily phosphohydrolase